MRGEIIYIHHNCFILGLGRKTLLFDYPDPSHLPQNAALEVGRRIEGTDLTVFISHCHADHFDPDIMHVTASAARCAYVVSDDVPDMFPGSVPDDALVVEPDRTYDFMGMRIETLESNDLGVAYCITDQAAIYYGGDLADWAWANLPRESAAAGRTFFTAALARLADRAIDAAFVNLDARLPNLAGGLDFARALRPRVFIPMHAFGSIDYLGDHRAAIEAMGVTPFIYRHTGDSLSVDFEHESGGKPLL
jgi:L-ascorbate metabolism protein UlaG (beta-lactamase superfamily)